MINKLKYLSPILRQLADNIDSGNSSLDESELDQVLDSINKLAIAENKLSKYQAAEYLGISTATFDNYVRDGKISEGRQQQGFKEKFWLLKDIKPLKKKK